MDVVDLTSDSPLSAHLAEAAAGPYSGQAVPVENGDEDGVLCDLCQQFISLQDWDSHSVAHELDQEAPQPQQHDHDQESADAALAAALAAAGASESNQLEEQEQYYFKELQQQFGFVQEARSGSCFLCGEVDHYVRECPKAPDNIEAANRMLLEPTPAKVAVAQRPDKRAAVEGGLLPVLTGALERQTLPPRTRYSALLCGALEHYQAQAFDAGWGCGYRNIQVQLSHLLLTSELARRLLLGGAGYVPDILSLQAWIECAWAAGFDPPGAEQLGGSLQASRKWIGTTECATLLRFFGVRARIIDFGTDHGRGGPGAAGSGASPDGSRARQLLGPGSATGAQEVHVSAQCDGCNVMPIIGGRYKSQVLADYDLCDTCYRNPPNPAAAPFHRMMPSRMQLGGPQHRGGGGAKAAGQQPHELLVGWVWRYFSEVPEGGEAKRSRLGAEPHSAVRQTARPPLYFQHQGHSRTIIGIERRETEEKGIPQKVHTLLVLDPGHSTLALAAALRTGQNWQRMLKRGQHTLRNDQYQLLFVEPGFASEEERSQLKTVLAHEQYK